MAVVTRGLGLPEEGSLVAFGLGRSALVGVDVIVPAVTVGGTVLIPGVRVGPVSRDGSPWGSVPITPVYGTAVAPDPAGSLVECAAVDVAAMRGPHAAAVTPAVAASTLAGGAARSRVVAVRHGSRVQRLPFDSRVDTATPTSEVGT